MRHTAFRKMSAALLSSGVLLSAASLPYGAVSAEESTEMTAVITLKDTAAEATGDNVTVDGTTVTITASGSYEISGNLDDGQIVVNVPDVTADAGTVQLFFNGVTITGSKEAPLYVINAKNTFLNLVENTENFLYDGETYTQTSAVIHAKDDITVKGTGKLRIEATFQHGVHCNNDFKLNGGNVKVKTQVGDGIRGKQSVSIKDGTLDINAKGDGVKSTKGTVEISGGHTEIKAGNDAVQGETSLVISGGFLKANGDRSLTNANGTVELKGGTVLATATDGQVADLTAEQNTLLFQTTAEQVKDQMISLKNAEEQTVYSVLPDKKFSYVLISDPALTVGSVYQLLIGDRAVADVTLSDTVTSIDPVTVPVVFVPNYDLDDDGTPDVRDAVLLARIVSNDPTLDIDDAIRSRSDVTNDGLTDSNDLIQMLKFLAHQV